MREFSSQGKIANDLPCRHLDDEHAEMCGFEEPGNKYFVFWARLQLKQSHCPCPWTAVVTLLAVFQATFHIRTLQPMT